MNILFLGGGKRVSLAERFLDAGLELGLDVNVFSYELEKNVPFTIVGEVIIGKLWNDKDIYVDLQKIIIEKKISIVIANVDSATIVLSKLSESFPELNMITSSTKICEIFLDKKLMSDSCERYGIKSIPLTNDDYPIFAKPRRGSASKGIHLIKDQSFKNYVNTIIVNSEYIFQKYIDGVEYTVDAYVSKNSKFIGAIPRIRTSVSSGESTVATVIDDKEIIEQTKIILSTYNLIGPLTLQFIRKYDELYFLELNPRFGGGVIASIQAGFNIPKIMLQDFLGVGLSPLKNYKRLVMTRCYREEFHAIDN